MTTITDSTLSDFTETVAARPPARLPSPVSIGTGSRFKDLVIVLSLVNLSYFRVWSELLTLAPADCFYLKGPFKASDYIAAMLGVSLIGVALWALVLFVRRHVRGKLFSLCQFIFVMVAVAGPGFAVQTVVMHAAAAGRIFGAHHPMPPELVSFFTVVEGLPHDKASRILAATLGCLILVLVVRFLRRVVQVTAVLLLCSSPFLVMTFSEAAYAAATHKFALIPDQQAARYLPVRGDRHVVWIVFDEWDYRLTFVDRDPSLRLDAIDQLRSETLFAEEALPPAHNTPESMPSYVNGRRVQTSVPESADRFRIRYADTGETAIWGAQPNVFSKARAIGVNAGVLGWYLPYCRVFGSSLAQCSWVPRAIPANTTGDTFLQKLVRQPRSILESTLLSPFGQSLSSQQHAKDYVRMDEEARRLVTDKRLGLVFAHLPGPHAPFVYDNKKHTLTRKNDLVRGYIDELALTNRTIANLRNALEESGEWDNTVLLVTSDHPFRNSDSLDGKSDPRVPFLLKMKGQHDGKSIAIPFNTVVSGDLALAILTGQVSTSEEATDWLQRHAVASQ
ncbi:MAG TPA: sulfatase-like hydrolase/transferase [Terriglobales bacterium]|nr:sulfatase-like hydrolase/transferase [Terriglobales bacterium]